MVNYSQLSGRDFPRFSAIKTFFRLPYASLDSDYDIGIVGVPFDGGVSYRPGARFAPTRIREISSLGRGFNLSRGFNFIDKIKVADIGDCQTVPIDINHTYTKIESFFSHLISIGKRFVAIGGDHSITLPILRQTAKIHGPLRLLHFDAHLDTYPAAWNCEYHHGTFLRHALKEGLIKENQVWLFGFRGPLAGEDDLTIAKKHNINIFSIDDIRKTCLNDFLSSVPSFKDNMATYLTFDIDCLDPSYAPGTGTPVIGGLTTYEVQRILRTLQINNLVGADIVEVSPPFDTSDITSLAAVDTLFEILGIYAENFK